MRLKSYERKTAGALLTLSGIGISIIAILGPLYTGKIYYATSPSGIYQLMGQDSVNLFLFGPAFAAGGILLWTCKPVGKYIAAISAIFLIYYSLSMGTGMEWNNAEYSGNSEGLFPLLLFFFISGLLLSAAVLVEFSELRIRPMPQKVKIPYTAVFLLFILLFAGMWISEIAEVLKTGTARGYNEAPTLFWVIRFLDLGLSIPLALLSIYMLWTRPESSSGIQMLLYGFFITMIVSVNSMGITMAIMGDADYVFSQQLIFIGIACIVFSGFALIVRRVHAPKSS